MAGTLKELVTRFGFEVDTKGLDELQEGIDSIKEGLLHLGELFLGEAAGLGALVERSAESGVQLKIMSEQTGIAADRLQELQFRAKLADVSADELNQSMNLLARNMDSARKGSTESIRNFLTLGVSFEQLRNPLVSTDQILQQVAKRFQSMPDGAQKTAAAMELFGRSGARLVPFLNSLGKAIDPVNQQLLEMSKITDAQIEQSEEFHVSLETLKTGLLGVARTVGLGLLPVATEIINTMKLWIVQNRELIVQNLTEFVKGIANALKVTLAIVNALVTSFTGFAHAIGGVRIATELLLGSLAVLSGVSVLFGIGKVIMAVRTLAASFAVADAAAAAIPIAIGAAVVALFPIFEDIYSFFAGKKSFTGDLVKALPELGNMFKSIFGGMFQPFLNIVNMITQGFFSWKELFIQLGTIFANALLTPIRSLVALLGTVISLAGRIPGLAGLKNAGADVQDFASNYLKLGGSPLTAPGVSAQNAIGPTDSSRQVNQDIDVHQEFNFPPGTDPTAVSGPMSTSISDGLDSVLRQAQRDTYNGGTL